METWLKDQLKYLAVFFIPSLAKYPFIEKDSEELERLREKTGSMVHGLCRCDKFDPRIKALGVNWVRRGICLPFDEDGNVTENFLQAKEELREFQAHGIKVLITTPSVGWYMGMGIDPRTPEGEEKSREIARFYSTELQGLANGFCICNEIGIPRFAYPLNLDQAVRFLGIQMEAMAPLKGDIVVGCNSVGPACDQFFKLRPWYPYMDWVGFDMYVGCFFPVLTQMGIFELLAKYLWAFTRKPVMLIEFGYLAGGAPKTKEEKRAILQKYGADSEKQARQNIDAFLEKFNETGRKYVEKCASGDRGKFVFGPDFRNHVYCELPRLTRIRGLPHTPEGQAEFYRRLLPRLEKLPFLGGMFIYTHRDDPKCSICGQSECPVETQWGLCGADGTPKAGYWAVQGLWGE
ncbi:MAG: hypothetical protein FWE98_08250 [Oscillospiraceae bacterium]|nr:hypothetical protein [Oscillospiraceae bacterium]